VSKLVGVTPNDDYTLLIEFERGNRILFNMERIVKTLPYQALSDLELFRKVRMEKPSVCWDTELTPIPIRFTVENILFAIRD